MLTMGNAGFSNPLLEGQDQRFPHYSTEKRQGCYCSLVRTAKWSNWPAGCRYIPCPCNSKPARRPLCFTDQEGATWVPDKIQHDELLPSGRVRRYSFPPARHPVELPGEVIGKAERLRFHGRSIRHVRISFQWSAAGTRSFLVQYNLGARCAGDGRVAGQKLWRTALAQTAAG